MSLEPIKVLQVVGSMGYGGIETWLMHVLRHADRRKFQFAFCHAKPTPGAYAPEIGSLGGRMVACPLEPSHPWDFARRFRAILRSERYDIVHSHVHHFSGFLMRLAHQERVAMRVAHCHNTSDGKGAGPVRALYRALMRHWARAYATCGLAASEDAAAVLFGANWRSDPRFRVLHCGIDLNPFRDAVSSEEVRREFGIPAGARVVGHIGGFRPAKNHAFFLRVAAEVLSRDSNLQFLLVGEGPLRAQAEDQARKSGLGSNTIFAGPRADVPRLMLGAMDLFLFPSLWEGLPITLLEAQAAGLPCVVSESVPAEAIVNPHAVHRLSLAEGTATWAAHVLEALEQGRTPQQEGLRAMETSSFNIEQSCDALTQLYAAARAEGKTG